MKTLFTMDETAVAVGVTRQTMYYWYRFKAKEPNNDYAKLLPNPITIGRQRFWSKSDINALMRYKKSLPKGRNGVMGCVTQAYTASNKRRNSDG